jgi:hypothetical protein
MPSRRPMNQGRLNDHDFVPPTQYNLSRTTKQLPDLSSLESLPKFKAMGLNNIKSSSQIPNTVNSSSPKALFSLFFTDSVLNLIVRCTNLNAERVRTDPITSRAVNIRFHESFKQKPCEPVNSDEILIFLGILIYMGIYVVPHINHYWNINEEIEPIHYPVRKAMSQNRWKQIHRYFHIWDPAWVGQFINNKVRPCEKVDPLFKLLLSSFQRYWKPGTNLAVDECIEGFTGRTNDIVNIPTKPTLIGFKIWVLADQGYVLDLLWHVKGDKKD